MKLYLSLFFLIFISFQSFAQKHIEKYVIQNLKPIKSIQPDFTDDSDLDEISKAIGDARIVMLGEQDHGDGAAFIAKTRLVKYLHEKQGFNVLAFEGDFFGLNHGWAATSKENQNLQKFLRFNIYPYWSRCRDCDNLLYDYIPKTYQTESPLQIAGFDNQLYMGFSKDSLKGYLNNYLKKEKVAFASSERFADFFLPFLDTLNQPWSFSTKPSTHLISKKHEKLKRFQADVDTILAQLTERDSQDYEIMLLKNLKALTEESFHYTENDIATNNIRDAQMAKNLEWLATQKYPSGKIIVWGASVHVSKGQGQTYKYPYRKQIRSMGSFFTQNSLFSSQTYIVGFASKVGASKRTIVDSATGIPAPLKKSFESWIDDKIPYAFVDLKKFRKLHPKFDEYYYLKGFSHYSEPAVWSDVFDGIFYIRDMTPCEESEFTQIVQKP